MITVSIDACIKSNTSVTGDSIENIITDLNKITNNGSNVNEIDSLAESAMTNFGSIDNDESTLSSKIYIYNITSATARTAVTFQSWNPVGSYMYYGMFMVNVTEAHNAFRIFPNSGSFATGRAKLYGISS